MHRRHLAAFILGSTLLACSGGDEGGDKATGDDTASTADGGGGDDTSAPGPDPICTEPTDLPCVDQMILDLSLHDDKVSEGEVSNTTEGADFYTFVDASAGGMNGAARNPWVYIKFTPEGAVRVDIDDETALESMDWDMALRRYIVRLNSGDSGPSCVGALASRDLAYADISAVPADASFAVEDIYNDTCDIQEDNSGLPGSPDVALGGWWDYPGGCVTTTMLPFLVQLADGHTIKLVIETYYGTGQEECNSSGTPGEDSGFIHLRWAYLP